MKILAQEVLDEEEETEEKPEKKEKKEKKPEPKKDNFGVTVEDEVPEDWDEDLEKGNLPSSEELLQFFREHKDVGGKILLGWIREHDYNAREVENMIYKLVGEYIILLEEQGDLLENVEEGDLGGEVESGKSKKKSVPRFNEGY